MLGLLPCTVALRQRRPSNHRARYLLLGPLQVVHDGRTVDIGPPKQRAVLATLLLARGAVVSTDRLIDAGWGDDVPGSATASLQAYISNLRKALSSRERRCVAHRASGPGLPPHGRLR